MVEASQKLVEISTEELMNELLRRCSPACFIGTKIDDEGVNTTFYEAIGHKTACAGLCEELKFEILKNMIREEINAT